MKQETLIMIVNVEKDFMMIINLNVKSVINIAIYVNKFIHVRIV